jgi:Glyoxalase-like domain
MNNEIERLHHVGHIVRSIDDGVALYRRLGFLPTPPNFYVLESAGSANQAIGPVNAYSAMKRNFLEIVSVATPQSSTSAGDPQVITVPPEQRDAFANRLAQAGDMISSWFSQFQGMRILALHSKDAEVSAARLTAAGIGNSGASTVNRKLDTNQGPRHVPTRFLEIGTPGQLPGAEVPEGRVAIAEDPDAEVLNQQKNLAHPNGALDLVESFLYVDAAGLDELTRRYEAYLGRTPQRTDSACRFDLGQGRVTLINDKGLKDIFPGQRAPASPAFIGYAVAVSDLAATRAYLQGNGFPLVDTPSRDILVPSSAALGAAILFRSAT